MERQLKLSQSFRSIKLKPHSTPNLNSNKASSSISISPPEKDRSWCVYLIASANPNPPFKTYVGVTTDFSRRLKQHNGELKGGAKASRGGRPWVCACIVEGFCNQSEACEFESNWKSLSRKLPRKRKTEGAQGQEEPGIHLLLRHRYAALDKLKLSYDHDRLEVDWKISPH